MFNAIKAAGPRKQFYWFGSAFTLVIALTISYFQIREVSLIVGRPALEANLLPLIVDIVGIMAALRVREMGITVTARIIARIVMWFAVATSVANNVLHAMLLGKGEMDFFFWWSIFLSALPALFLLGVSEMLIHTHKRATPPKKPAAAPPAKPKAKSTTPRQRSRSTSTKIKESATATE